MADTDDADEPERTDVNVRLPTVWLHEELMPLYPAALSPSEVVRMALMELIEDKSELVAGAEVDNAVIEMMETEGGSIETTLRISIGDVEELTVDSAQNVSVSNETED